MKSAISEDASKSKIQTKHSKVNRSNPGRENRPFSVLSRLEKSLNDAIKTRRGFMDRGSLSLLLFYRRFIDSGKEPWRTRISEHFSLEILTSFRKLKTSENYEKVNVNAQKLDIFVRSGDDAAKA